jgi:hypothetical protein
MGGRDRSGLRPRPPPSSQCTGTHRLISLRPRLARNGRALGLPRGPPPP